MRLLQTTGRSLTLSGPDAHGVLYYFEVKDFTPISGGGTMCLLEGQHSKAQVIQEGSAVH